MVEVQLVDGIVGAAVLVRIVKGILAVVIVEWLTEVIGGLE